MSEQIEWNCHNCDADNSVCDCKQEPVAWMCKDGLCISAKAKAYHEDGTPEYSTPLYVHPQREFSDEAKIACWCNEALLKFAREILKAKGE